MKCKILTLFFLFLIPMFSFGQNKYLDEFIKVYQHQKHNYKVKRKDLKKIGKFSIKEKRAYFLHGRWRTSKEVHYGDTLEISLSKKGIFHLFKLSGITIKFPFQYTTSKGVTVGESTKKDVIDKLGKPKFKYDDLFIYDHFKIYFPNKSNNNFPLNKSIIDKGLENKVIAILM